MPINAGRVVYSRTIQVAQFEPKKVDVEVSFVVGDKETFNELLDEAMDKVPHRSAPIRKPHGSWRVRRKRWLFSAGTNERGCC